jgi:hypothetical protein
MILPLVVDEIRRLLQQRELSQRAIARRLGVSRGTVNTIFSGKRRDRVCCGLDHDAPCGPPERCPGCGGMVQMPCLVCRIRWLRKTRRLHGVD